MDYQRSEFVCAHIIIFTALIRYRNDFDERDSVKFCRRFVNKEKQAMLLEATLSVFTIKYENCSGQFYANLMLLNDGESTLDRDRCE